MNENKFYQMFKRMMASYNKGNTEDAVGYGRSLFQMNPENKYPENSEERNLFELIKIYYPDAAGYSVGNKYAGRQIDKMILEFCALKPKNLFTYDKEQAAIEAAAEKQAEKERKRIIQEKEIKAAEEEAERIVQYEEQQKKLQLKKEETRIMREAEAAEKKERHEALVKEFVEKKKAEKKEYVFGVIPEKKNWLKSLFRKKDRE